MSRLLHAVIDDATFAILTEMAKAQERSRSSIVAILLRRAVGQHEMLLEDRLAASIKQAKQWKVKT